MNSFLQRLSEEVPIEPVPKGFSKSAVLLTDKSKTWKVVASAKQSVARSSHNLSGTFDQVMSNLPESVDTIDGDFLISHNIETRVKRGAAKSPVSCNELPPSTAAEALAAKTLSNRPATFLKTKGLSTRLVKNQPKLTVKCYNSSWRMLGTMKISTCDG